MACSLLLLGISYSCFPMLHRVLFYSRDLPTALLTAACGLFNLATHAQSVAPRWQSPIQTGPGLLAAATWTDPAGTTYVAGRIRNAAALPGVPPLGPNPDAPFLACLDSANAWRWVQTIATDSGTCAFTGVAGDGRGGLYVTGAFTGTVTLGPGGRIRALTIASSGFVAHYDAAGTLGWARAITNSSYGVGYPLLAADPSGTATVAFALGGGGGRATQSLGAFQVQSTGSNADVVVARISPQGTWVGVAQSTGSASEYPADLDVDTQGNAVVTGIITSSRQWVNPDSIAQFGPIRFAVPVDVVGGSVPGPPYTTMYVAKVSAQGQWQWANCSRGSAAQSGSVTVSPAGDVYLVAGGDSATVFGGTFSPLPTATYSAVIAKVNAAGQWQWLRTSNGWPLVTLTPAGHPCLVGTFEHALYLDSTRLVLDSLPRTTPTAYHLGVVQLDPAGQPEWVLTARGSGERMWQWPLTGAGMDARGRLTVVGAVFDSLTLGPVVLTTPARATTGASVFVAHVGPVGPTASPEAVSAAEIRLYPNPVRRGQPFTLDVPTGWTDAQVEVLNAVGQRVRTGAAAGRLPTAGLPAGLYTVRVWAAERQLTRRLVVE